MCQTDLSLFDVGGNASVEMAEVHVNDSRSLDEILASISGGQESHAEIFEALKSVATTRPESSPRVESKPAVPPTEASNQFVCPMCDAPVDAVASACPNCGARFEEGEAAEFECPVCRATVAPDANRCPACGVLFAEEEPAVPEPPTSALRAVASPPAPKPPPPKPASLFGSGVAEKLAALRKARREFAVPSLGGDRKLMYRELPKVVNDVRGLLVAAKRMGLEIEKEKHVINDAIAAGKQRDVERALRTIGEARKALEIAITEYLSKRIEASVQEVNRVGPMEESEKVEKLIQDAVSAIEARTYEASFDRIEEATKGFQTQARDYVEARDSLNSGDRLLADVKALGMDVGDIERLLKDGREAMARKDQTRALRSSTEARERLATALPTFVDQEMKKARNVLLDMKVRGGDLSKPVAILKAASVHAKKEEWSNAVRYLKEFRREIGS